VPGIVDLKFGHVDLDRIGDQLRPALHIDRVRDDVDRAAALDAGRLVGLDHHDRDGDADLRALTEPHEVDMHRIVQDRIELEVARDHAMLHAVDSRS
jgi:hypothetical protein